MFATFYLILSALVVSTVPQTSASTSIPASPAIHPTAATTCPACTDFYTYANKTWLDSASIPPGKSSWGGFDTNAARMQAQLHAILDSTATAVRKGRSSSVLGIFFASCMDTAAAERAGVSPLAGTFADIDAVRDASGVLRESGRLQRDGVDVLFNYSSDVDRIGNLHYVAIISGSRPGLPGNRSYTAKDSASVAARDAYVAYITRMLELTGEPSDIAHANAERAMSLETALVQASMSAPAGSDDDLAGMFRVSSPAALRALTPGLDWSSYYAGRGVRSVGRVIISEPALMTGIAKLLQDRPVAEWRAYLKWRRLADASPWLSSSFSDTQFQFQQRFSGATIQLPRWQRCVDESNTQLTELLGRAYVKRAFSESSKARVNAMVKQIRTILVSRLQVVPWLTDASRKEALAKAAAFRVKIGYPDKWHDFSALKVAPGSFLVARDEARRFEADRMVGRIGTVPNRAEWDFHSFYHFLPQSPTDWANWDEIIFPAAALQPPFFDPKADDATNFGAIGEIIGHEMTHLFTADGGSIDSQGRIRRWWNAEDSVRFDALSKRVVDQYNRFAVLDSVTHVNGEQTLSENLADIGGIQLSFAAFERVRDRDHLSVVDGRTPEQRFFLANAHAKAEIMKPEYARTRLAIDGHAPAKARVNVPLSNFAPFAAAFRCKDGDPMARRETAQVW